MQQGGGAVTQSRRTVRQVRSPEIAGRRADPSRIGGAIRVLQLARVSPSNVAKVIRRFLFGTDVVVLPLREAIAHLDAKRLSLVRWGDGETEIAIGRDIYYQSASERLADALSGILDQADDKVVVGLPGRVLRGTLSPALYTSGWLKTRWLWAARARRDATYADAFMFRDAPRQALALINEIAARKSKVMVVSSHGDDLALLGSAEGKAIWIKVPSTDAYACVESVCAAVRSAAVEEASTLVLVAAGPAAKVIVSRLSAEFVCWDVGFLLTLNRMMDED